jgi:hypothetical protein
VRMVFTNFGDAIKVTGVLYLAMFVAQIVLLPQPSEDILTKAATISIQPTIAASILYLIIAMIASIWAVIGWHRYVLLEERPTILPKLLPANMLSYFWRTIVLTLIISFLIAIPGGLGGMVASYLGAMLGMAVGVVIAVFIAYRLSPVFPAVALGNSMTFGDAWDKFRGKNGMLIGLSLVSVALHAILSIPAYYLVPSSVPAQAYLFVIGWLQFTIGASIVTTLYGVYVEGRELPRA